MKISVFKRISASTTVLIFVFSAFVSGQSYSFRNFGAESNIPSGFVYTIDQTPDGFLWLGTGNGITRFDGYTFFTFPDSAEGRNPTASLRDKQGNIWYGFNDGSISYASENKLISVPIKNSRSISDLIEGPDGLIFIIPQGKAIFSIDPLNPEEIKQYSISEDVVMSSAGFTEEGKLLIGTQENILICNLEKDTTYIEGTIEGFEYSKINSIHSTPNNSVFILGTDGSGIFRLKIKGDHYELSRFKDHPDWEMLNVQSIIEDTDKSVWVSTFGSGVLRIEFSKDSENIKAAQYFTTETGLTANDVKTVFQDIEGNYWMGFYGEGLSILQSYALGYYQPGKNSIQNNIIYTKEFNDRYILGTPSGFHLFDAGSGKSLSFTDLSGPTGKSVMTSYFLDDEKNLWIGTAGNGLFMRNKSGSVKCVYRSGDSGSDYINDIIVKDGNVWLATANGVVILNGITGEERVRFDINSGHLDHNFINKLLEADGYIYVGTESARMYKIDNQFVLSKEKMVMVGNTKNKILSVSHDKNGSIWVATQGNGVFKYLNDTISSLTRAEDLMSNYCYSVLSDNENYVWIGHEKGFSRFDQGKRTMKSFGIGFAVGGVCNPGAMIESKDMKIFIGTTSGLIIYDKLKDKQKQHSPYTSINSVTINDVVYPYQPSFYLPYNKRNVIRINYSGINFSDPDRVFYSTYLENFDDDWTKMTTSREVSYSLSDGKYVFSLVAAGEEGISHEPPLSFGIIIRPPVWRTWWFILLMLISLAGIVVLIIRERDKSRKSSGIP